MYSTVELSTTTTNTTTTTTNTTQHTAHPSRPTLPISLPKWAFSSGLIQARLK
jgi:hypothetical protein